MVGTEMARMDSVLTVPEFTDPRPAPTAPPGPRFTDSTIRSTVSDPEVLGVRDIFSLEYLKRLQRTTKRRYNIRRVAWRHRPSNVAGVEGLREDLSVKNSDITCIEFIDDDLVDCGELVLISKVNTSQDSNSPMGALTVQKASKGLDAKGKLKQSDNMLTKVEQTPGPSVSSEMPVKAPVAPRAAAKAATPNEPTPGACTCTICERAKKQANIDEMSEEEQVELALSRSMDEYFMPSYKSAALRRQAVMVN
ncbi:hypothetical protein FRC02_004891 [Tulasnella sp. 418]|nr:hypothetical protein FRC02_004891 [Tulasnella sp. 418]